MKNVNTFKDTKLNKEAKKIIRKNKDKLLKIFEDFRK